MTSLEPGANATAAANLDASIHQTNVKHLTAHPLTSTSKIPAIDSEGKVIAVPYRSGMSREEFHQYMVNLDWEVNHDTCAEVRKKKKKLPGYRTGMSKEEFEEWCAESCPLFFGDALKINDVQHGN